MICPSCQSEYRDGYIRCRDCDVDLVDFLERSATEADVALVKVYETGDAALIPLYQSVLDDAGIEYVTRNEGVQDLFGLGRIGPNLNYVTGSVEFYVRADDAHDAAELTRVLDMTHEEDDNDPEESTPSDTTELRDAVSFIAGTILGPVSLWAIYDSWSYPYLGFLLLMLSFNLIAKSTRVNAGASPSAASTEKGSKLLRWIKSFFEEGIREGFWYLVGAAILTWGWDVIRVGFPSFAATVPVANQGRIVGISAVTIFWLLFYVSSIVKQKQHHPRVAA